MRRKDVTKSRSRDMLWGLYLCLAKTRDMVGNCKTRAGLTLHLPDQGAPLVGRTEGLADGAICAAARLSERRQHGILGTVQRWALAQTR